MNDTRTGRCTVSHVKETIVQLWDNRLLSLRGLEHVANLKWLEVRLSHVVCCYLMCFAEGGHQSPDVAGWHRALDQFDGTLGELFVVVSIVVVIDVQYHSGIKESVVIAGGHRALDQFDGTLGELFVVISIVIVIIDMQCRSGIKESVVIAGGHRTLDQFDDARRELFVVVSIVVAIDVRCRSGGWQSIVVAEWH